MMSERGENVYTCVSGILSNKDAFCWSCSKVFLGTCKTLLLQMGLLLSLGRLFCSDKGEQRKETFMLLETLSIPKMDTLFTHVIAHFPHYFI